MKIYLKAKGATVGKKFMVQSVPRFLMRDGASFKNLYIGDNVYFDGRVYFRFRKDGIIKLGNNVNLGAEVWLVVAKDNCLSIGCGTSISSYCVLNGGHGIDIGNDCLLACFVYLISSNHNIGRDKPIKDQGHSGAKIVIGNDVWIGGQVCVLPNVKIADGAVIGAGSVVNKNVSQYEIAAGTPAHNIGFRE